MINFVLCNYCKCKYIYWFCFPSIHDLYITFSRVYCLHFVWRSYNNNTTSQRYAWDYNSHVEQGGIVRPWLRRPPTLRKLYFHFLSHWMGYDCGDSFPFDFNWKMEQFSKWNSIWFKIERKNVTSIISHSMWKEMEI